MKTQKELQAQADEAFERAISSGRLSRDESADNYVGDYMYMGTSPKIGDLFKHYRTREYLDPVTP